MDGRDITEDLRSKLDQVPTRHKPRFYKFRVEYKDKKGNTVDNEQTGKGEIMLILPRHPDETQALEVMSFNLLTHLHCLIYIKQFAYFGGYKLLEHKFRLFRFLNEFIFSEEKM